jgi:putative methyltransferase (TIGR04325 family)
MLPVHRAREGPGGHQGGLCPGTAHRCAVAVPLHLRQTGGAQDAVEDLPILEGGAVDSKMDEACRHTAGFIEVARTLRGLVVDGQSTSGGQRADGRVDEARVAFPFSRGDTSAMPLAARHRIGNLARRVLPPLAVDLLRWARRRGKGIGFEGRFDSFESARRAARSRGYEEDSVVDATVSRTRQLQQTLGADQTYTLNSGAIQDLAAILVGLGLASTARMRVLDFGGAMGAHYLTLGPFLRAPGGLEWTICETRSIAEAGQRYFANGELGFTSGLDGLEGPFDLAIASGSLQYVESPAQVLERLAQLSNVLVINRLPLTDQSDYLAVQTAPTGARYPAWFFSEPGWLHKMTSAGFRVLMRWSAPEDTALSNGRTIPYQGMVATRGEAHHG